MDEYAKKQEAISKELIAQCGMNCAVCSKYLAYVNNLHRSQCTGCQSKNKKCMYLFKNCSGPENSSDDKTDFCHECDRYPCKDIDRVDKRYKEGYHMSIKDNLEYIKEHGVDEFIDEQYEKYKCPHCNNVVSVHNRKCFKCETIAKLVEKYT